MNAVGAEEYLTLTDAVKELGISRSTLYRRIEEGAMPTYFSPANRRIKLVRRADVEALLAPQPATPVAPRQMEGNEVGH